jgi:hypothetical protein
MWAGAVPALKWIAGTEADDCTNAESQQHFISSLRLQLTSAIFLHRNWQNYNRQTLPEFVNPGRQTFL